jgi:hypothetical protein
MARPQGTVSEHIGDVFEFNFAGQMGAERAPDVTPGGAREHGEFGQQQSAWVTSLNDPVTNPVDGDPHYGQWLQDHWFI